MVASSSKPSLLNFVKTERGPSPFRGRVLVVVAHPDDEIISAGALISLLPEVFVVQVTNGAPPDMADARNAGFTTKEDYALARRAESLCALALAGLTADRLVNLEFGDQEASFHLPELVRKLLELIAGMRPAGILTHAYEGGHPDHDATAFGVHNALKLLGRRKPELVEFTSYHSRDGELAVFDFLPHEGSQAVTMHLSRELHALKMEMYQCFPSQTRVLEDFPVCLERFRPAPLYEFRQAPHAGVLHYEKYHWGINGERWRSFATEALDALKLCSSSASL